VNRARRQAATASCYIRQSLRLPANYACGPGQTTMEALRH